MNKLTESTFHQQTWTTQIDATAQMSQSTSPFSRHFRLLCGGGAAHRSTGAECGATSCGPRPGCEAAVCVAKQWQHVAACGGVEVCEHVRISRSETTFQQPKEVLNIFKYSLRLVARCSRLFVFAANCNVIFSQLL